MPPPSRLPAWAPDSAGTEFASREVAGVEPPPGPKSPPRPPRPALDPAALAAGLVAGDRAALSRAITLIESNAPHHRPLARNLLGRLPAPLPHPTIRLGISGVPGAGKSTFIEAMGNFLCDRGHRVAVLAVDPSSTLSGGSILGDKTRMETLARRPECFIRPSPSGGALGGVTRKTRETISLCEAAGHDIVLVETVGVGQSEIAVRSMVDCFVLVLIAGAGDELQGMKRGIVEISDLLAVNKADGENRPRALATRAEFDRVMHYLSPATEGWTPRVLAVSSLERTGLDDLWGSVEEFLAHMHATGQFAARRRRQALEWWHALVEQELRIRFQNEPRIAALSAQLEQSILDGHLQPSLAAEELLKFFQPLRES